VHGVVLTVMPPLEVVIDGDLAVCKRFAVFADFALNSERNVLEFPKYFSPSSYFSFLFYIVLKNTAQVNGIYRSFCRKMSLHPSRRGEATLN